MSPKNPLAKATMINVGIRVEIKAIKYLFSFSKKRNLIVNAKKIGPPAVLTNTQANILP